ncbi:MAG: S41 family peptidase [Phycisphaerales bacterium]
MTNLKHRMTPAGIASLGLGLLLIAGSPTAMGGEPQSVAAVSEPVSNNVWSAARKGQETEFTAALSQTVAEREAEVNESFRTSVDLLEANFEKREQQRAERLAEVNTEFEGYLDEARVENDPIDISHALTSAVEMQLLMRDDDKLFADARVAELIERAEQAARGAESRGDWLIANELYYRLDTLLDKESKYDEAIARMSTRLNMIRMYAPERLWELRNARRIAEDEEPLPPYNPYGDDYREKLQGIKPQMIYRALLRAAGAHVSVKNDENPNGITMGTLLDGGLKALETMAGTADLHPIFPGLADAGNRARFQDTLRGLRRSLADMGDNVDLREMRRVLERTLQANQDTIRISEEAILHEFGNGSMGVLDDYTAVIWPDELARFRRSTQGEFIGVGIQIALDELLNIEVVTPLEGTPAQRAGIRTGDVIKKVDGLSAVGLGLDQAVEVITGPPDTRVTLTVEREVEGAEGDETEEIEFTLVRKRIDLPSVKGWRKTGPGDHDWDWFIDPQGGVGYVRLTGFTEDTTRDFDRAIAAMKQQGLSSLILDLRYNPGGLLDQAVEISSRFVPEGLIVRTETGSGIPTGEPLYSTRPSRARSLADLPVVVLVNEGSASASEIVSGAVQAAAQKGRVQALVVGQRSFGKGSVQNVFSLSGGAAAMKLTTQYYRIDSPRLIHRVPGATEWGIDPDLEVEMLPEQQVDALLLRRNSDVLPLDENGDVIADAERPDPDTLLTDGIDLQVQTALVLLQSQNADPALQAVTIEQ